jgi:hypothetical protein
MRAPPPTRISHRPNDLTDSIDDEIRLLGADELSALAQSPAALLALGQPIPPAAPALPAPPRPRETPLTLFSGQLAVH